MKNFKMLCASTCLALFAVATVFTGCEKKEIEKSDKAVKAKGTLQENTASTNLGAEIDVNTLKVYMAELINANVNEISYDQQTEQFVLFGVNQISKTDLTKSYHNNH